MDLTQISLSDFLVVGEDTTIPADGNRFMLVVDLYASGVGRQPLFLRDGYSIHQYNNQLGDVLLLHDETVVGAYVGELLDIAPEHTRNGLSTPLILQAISNRDLPQTRTLSCAGRIALTRAWRVANGEDCAWPRE